MKVEQQKLLFHPLLEQLQSNKAREEAQLSHLCKYLELLKWATQSSDSDFKNLDKIVALIDVFQLNQLNQDREIRAVAEVLMEADELQEKITH